jgi:beta-galactosidase GanA
MDLARVLLTLTAANGVKVPIEAPQGVEVTMRGAGRQKLIYLLNHAATAQTVKLEGSYKDVISGTAQSGSVGLDAYGVRVLRPA